MFCYYAITEDGYMIYWINPVHKYIAPIMQNTYHKTNNSDKMINLFENYNMHYVPAELVESMSGS